MGQEYSLKGLTLVKIEKKLTNSFNNVKQDLKELKKQASSLNSKSETSNLDLQSIRKSYTRADKFLILEKKNNERN